MSIAFLLSVTFLLDVSSADDWEYLLFFNTIVFQLQLHLNTQIHMYNFVTRVNFLIIQVLNSTRFQFLQFLWCVLDILSWNKTDRFFFSGLLQSAMTFRLPFCLFVSVSFDIICSSCHEFKGFPFGVANEDAYLKFSALSLWKHVVRYDVKSPKTHKTKIQTKDLSWGQCLFLILLFCRW